MTRYEEFEACMRQAEFAYGMHNGRRQWEWKITLGLWAVILTTIIKEIDIPLWVWIFVVMLYALCWLRPIWIANENNKVWYDHFMTEAAYIIQDENHQIDGYPDKIAGWCKHFGFLRPRAWSMIFQMLTTAILAGIAYFF